MDRIETDFTDEERALIEPLSPVPLRKGRRRELDMRSVINAIQLMFESGRLDNRPEPKAVNVRMHD